MTQNGRPTTFLANVRDWDAFVEFCEQRELREDVAAAESELDAGLGIPHEQLKREVAAEIDVIVTNPPFSLFKEFLAWILEGDSCSRGDRENVEKG